VNLGFFRLASLLVLDRTSLRLLTYAVHRLSSRLEILSSENPQRGHAVFVTAQRLLLNRMRRYFSVLFQLCTFNATVLPSGRKQAVFPSSLRRPAADGDFLLQEWSGSLFPNFPLHVGTSFYSQYAFRTPDSKEIFPFARRRRRMYGS